MQPGGSVVWPRGSETAVDCRHPISHPLLDPAGAPSMDDDIPYLLLTPGPLTTTRSVRAAMLQDYCTWDDEYNQRVSEIRNRLVRLAAPVASAQDPCPYTSVLMQGSGTFVVEATIGSVLPARGKLLVLSNGAYGRRIAQIAARLGINHRVLEVAEICPPDLSQIERTFQTDRKISHVAMVHCETTTGMLNPVAAVGRLVKQYGKMFLLDAMSSFGGIPLSCEEIGASFLISSANKCIQGTPGFGFVIADRQPLTASEGSARSLSLDLFDQWREMEEHGGKWRYTSPTHVVRAFLQALIELEEEGGVDARYQRYTSNQTRLVEHMEALGFKTLLPRSLQSPIITSFLFPTDAGFAFGPFYEALKRRRFVIYPGKASRADTFRIGTIGNVFPSDIDHLATAVSEAIEELNLSLR